MTPEDIGHRFRFHPVDTLERRIGHERVRTMCGTLASELNDLLPEGREKSLAVTNLEQVMFWANAAIARNLTPSV